jgi:group I intron endonuclease
MFYYLYEVKNKINGKIYVGVHRTKNLDDGYMGSGRAINAAIKKYGLTNFEKQILEFFNNAKDMYDKEKQIVNDTFLSDPNTYNIRRGGHGGFDHINKDKDLITLRNRKIASNRDHTNIRAATYAATQTKTFKQNMSIAQKKRFATSPGTFLNKTHTLETKEKMRQSHVGKGCGESNSQFGTIWINNGTDKMKIKKDATIPDGWRRGMK